MSELAPKNIREKIRLGLTLLPVIEENIESTGLVTFRDLFLLLKDTKSSATDPLRIVTHLCHAGLLSGISLTSETLSERNVFLEKIIFSLSQIVKKEKAKETVLWIARQKNQTRFFKIFNWISQDLNKSTRLGVNISNGLFIMGSSNSPQIYQLFSEMIEKLQTLNDQEIEAVLELLSHPVLNSVTTI